MSREKGEKEAHGGSGDDCSAGEMGIRLVREGKLQGKKGRREV